jgi:mRNA-degrading endonuclease toxin of MazEF toxin-antitoxin module
VLPWQIMTISENRLEDLLAVLDADLMAEVERALRVLWRLT